MKRVIAIIPRQSLDAVREALLHLDVGGITLNEVFETFRPVARDDEDWGLDPEGLLRLEILTLPESVDAMVQAITDGVRETANRSRGIIFVAPLEEVIRIRTQEIQTAAIL